MFILGAREAVCWLSFPRRAINTNPIRSRRWATTLQLRRITSSSILHRTNLWPRLHRGAIDAVIRPERRRAAVGHVAGWKLSSIWLRDVEVVWSRRWRLHWLVVGPGSGG